MSGYARGVRAEHRARKLLEAAGYTVVRAAGSKGVADLVAWDTTTVRVIQVKRGARGASPAEREALQMLPRPANASVEVWRFPARAAPIIERL